MSRIVHAKAKAVVSSGLLAMAKLSCQGEAGSGRGADREAAICQAVVELLNETSYESVTMDAVAARAKASKATIYRRWSNKDELVMNALRGMVVGRNLLLAETGNLRDDLVAGISAQMKDPLLAAVNNASLKVLVYAASTDPALAEEVREAIRDTHMSAWQTVLHRAYVRGELNNQVDPGLVFEVLQGQFCARTSVDAQPLDDRYVQHVVDYVLMPVILHAGAATPHSRLPAEGSVAGKSGESP